MEQDAVVLERERALRPRSGKSCDAARELGLAIRANETADPLELVVAHPRIPATDAYGQIVRREWLLQVHELEEAVDRVADLRRSEARRTGHGASLVGRPHADDPLGVVAVRAPVEQRERTERKASNAMDRRHGNLAERLHCRHERGQHADTTIVEES